MTYIKASDPAHGTVSFSGSTVTYTPTANYSGTDSFTFKVKDSKGAESTPAMVSIDVTKASRGTLVIVSNVKDANIYLDGVNNRSGVSLGKTILGPLAFTYSLKIGSYQNLKITKQGYDPYQQASISITENSETNIQANLTAKLAAINVSTQPKGAKVSVDEVLRGNTTDGTLTISNLTPLVPHSIRFELDDYETRELLISPELQPGETRTLDPVSFTYLLGSLTVQSSPSGASVYLNNSSNASGVTPLTINNLASGVAHEARLELDGYKTEYIYSTPFSGSLKTQTLTPTLSEKGTIPSALARCTWTATYISGYAGTIFYGYSNTLGSSRNPAQTYHSLANCYGEAPRTQKLYVTWSGANLVAKAEPDRYYPAPQEKSHLRNCIAGDRCAPNTAATLTKNQNVNDLWEGSCGSYWVTIKRDCTNSKAVAELRSDPPGAQIYIAGNANDPTPPNGSSYGYTNKYFDHGIADGKEKTYRFKMLMPDYEPSEILFDPWMFSVDDLSSVSKVFTASFTYKFGNITITSDPAGANTYVFENNQWVNKAKTPSTVKVLKGSPQLKLVLPNYEEDLFSVNVTAGETVPIQRTLKPKPGFIDAKTIRNDTSAEVTGARIHLDGVEQQDLTPIRLNNITPGTHTVQFFKDGYKPSAVISVTIQANKGFFAKGTFEPLPGKLRVIANRSGTNTPIEGVAIRLDGKIESKNITGANGEILIEPASPKAHNVELVHSNYRANPIIFTITVEPGKEFILQGQLIPNFGTIIVRTKPAGVNVTVKAKSTTNTVAQGQTTPRVPENEDHGYFNADFLSVGNYLIEGTAPGYSPTSATVDNLTAGETRSVELNLQKTCPWMVKEIFKANLERKSKPTYIMPPSSSGMLGTVITLFSIVRDSLIADHLFDPAQSCGSVASAGSSLAEGLESELQNNKYISVPNIGTDSGEPLSPNIAQCLISSEFLTDNSITEDDRKAVISEYYYLITRLESAALGIIETIASIDSLKGNPILGGVNNYDLQYVSRPKKWGTELAKCAPAGSWGNFANETISKFKSSLRLKKKIDNISEKMAVIKFQLGTLNGIEQSEAQREDLNREYKLLEKTLSKSTAKKEYLEGRAPWITTQEFNSVEYDQEELKLNADIIAVLNEYLQQKRVSLVNELDNFKGAIKCLVIPGDSRPAECAGFDDIIAKTTDITPVIYPDLVAPNNVSDPLFIADSNFAKAACYRTIRGVQKQAEQAFDSFVANAALTVATANLSSVATTGGTIWKTLKIAATGKTGINTLKAADVAYAAMVGLDLYSAADATYSWKNECANYLNGWDSKFSTSIENPDGIPQCPVETNKIGGPNPVSDVQACVEDFLFSVVPALFPFVPTMLREFRIDYIEKALKKMNETRIADDLLNKFNKNEIQWDVTDGFVNPATGGVVRKINTADGHTIFIEGHFPGSEKFPNHWMEVYDQNGSLIGKLGSRIEGSLNYDLAAFQKSMNDKGVSFIEGGTLSVKGSRYQSSDDLILKNGYADFKINGKTYTSYRIAYDPYEVSPDVDIYVELSDLFKAINQQAGAHDFGAKIIGYHLHQGYPRLVIENLKEPTKFSGKISDLSEYMLNQLKAVFHPNLINDWMNSGSIDYGRLIDKDYLFIITTENGEQLLRYSPPVRGLDLSITKSKIFHPDIISRMQ